MNSTKCINWIKEHIDFSFVSTKRGTQLLAYNKDLYYLTKSINRTSKHILNGEKLEVNFSFINNNVLKRFTDFEKNRIYEHIRKYIQYTMFLKDNDPEIKNISFRFREDEREHLKFCDILDVFHFILYYNKNKEELKKEMTIKLKCDYMLNELAVGKHLS
jgi:hypothetical protein